MPKFQILLSLEKKKSESKGSIKTITNFLSNFASGVTPSENDEKLQDEITELKFQIEKLEKSKKENLDSAEENKKGSLAQEQEKPKANSNRENKQIGKGNERFKKRKRRVNNT